MERIVPDDGPQDARLVLVGEAPGKWEERYGRPFVGAAGQLLNRWMADVGLDRAHTYVTNVCPVRPQFDKIHTVPQAEMEGYIEQLHARLAALQEPWLIVPMGNTALYALTGQAYPPWQRRRGGFSAPGIVSHRGSIYYTVINGCRDVKVIPTIHPAAVLRTTYWEYRCRADWRRIADELAFPELRLPEREHLIAPTLNEVDAFVGDAIDHAELLSLDIETPRQIILEPAPTRKGAKWRRVRGEPYIACIAFSYEPSFSITIPTTLAYWGDPTILAAVWRRIRTLCMLPCEKVLQNGLFDTWWLRKHNVSVENWMWDTMALHHCLYPWDDHDLAYQASIYTKQPYWKDEAKDPDEISKYATGTEALWSYCGTDAAVQRELAEVHIAALEKAGMTDFYHRHYADVLGSLVDMMSHGIAVDGALGRRRHATLRAQSAVTQDRLAELTGERLYGPKGSLSAKKLAHYLYDILRLPRQIDRVRKTPTTREVVVRKLMLRFPGKLNEVGDLILQHRRTEKLVESYDPKLVSADGRMRTSYTFSPETGRLSSSKAPDRRGRNMQNTDRQTRCFFRPDEGCLFLCLDLSQIEDRIVKMYTKEPRLIERARSMPWEYDEHTNTAVLIYGAAREAVTYDQRYLAKRGRHGANYGLQGPRLAEELLKEDYVLTNDECQRIIDAIHRFDPEIQECYQREIRKRIMRDRELTNTWGRQIDFSYERMNDELYRRAYAWVAQSEPPAIINQWGLVPLSARIRAEQLRTRIHVQGHDSLLCSVPFAEAWDVAAFLRRNLEQPRTYAGNELTVPVTMQLGWWKCECASCRAHPRTAEWKCFPSKAEFEECFTELYRLCWSEDGLRHKARRDKRLP